MASLQRKRCLAIGDLHIKIGNVKLIEVFLQKLRLYLETCGSLEFIVILGDTLNDFERIHSECLSLCTRYFDLCCMYAKTYVIVGNHDMLANTSFLSESHSFVSFKKWNQVNLVIVDKPVIVSLGSKSMVLCPYVEPGRFRDALDTVKVDMESVFLIFCHQEFRGCPLGSTISEKGDDWDTDMPLVISGHIHDRVWLKDTVYYPGSVLDHDLCVLEYDDKCSKPSKTCIQYIKLDLPVNQTLNVDKDSVTMSYVDSLILKKTTLNKIKLIVNIGTNGECQAFRRQAEYRKLLTHGIKVVLNQPKQLELEQKARQANDLMPSYYELVRKNIEKHSNVYLDSDYKELVIGNS